MTADGYTWSREPAAEALAERAVAEIRAALTAALPRTSYRAILLVGGYGRGEGGVRRTAEGVRLNNNLDVLVIAAGPWVALRGPLHARAADALRPLASRLGVGIDVGVIGEWTLRHAPCRVFYYDLRFGHRTIAGDAAYAPSLPFEAGAIIGEDMLALVANRGTLLAINQELYASGAPARATVVKHIVKAILGYGDGWLWTRGQYHWSYVERHQRMARADAPAGLARLYAEAAMLRFQPREDAFAGVDLRAWNTALLAELEPLHRAVVERVDGRFAGWDAHVVATSARARVRALIGARPSLPRLFPLIAYPGAARGATLAARALAAAPDDPAGLRRGYLRAWGVGGDPNFGAAATSMGLAIGATS